MTTVRSGAGREDRAHSQGQAIDDIRRARDVWQGLGLPGIIDVHTHFMPQSVLGKVWAYFDAVDTPAGPWSIHYRRDQQTRIETLRALGVRRFGALNYAHKPGMAR